MIVVDASISLKWFLPEVNTAEALALLRGGLKLVAPEIIKYEVISGLVRRVRQDQLAASEANESVEDWLDALSNETVHLIIDDRLLVEAAQIACDIKHPLCDCLYLALARRLEAPFVTADRTLMQRASTVLPDVYSLQTIPSNFLGQAI